MKRSNKHESRLKAGVYALVDPFDGLPHYVGSSSWLRERVLDYQALFEGTSLCCHNQAIIEWVEDLRAKRKRPSFVVLQLVPGNHHKEAESWWIKHGRAKGWPLLNRR